MLRHEVRELGLRGLKLHGVPAREMVETAAELTKTKTKTKTRTQTKTQTQT
jgi:hypothetical protein